MSHTHLLRLTVTSTVTSMHTSRKRANVAPPIAPTIHQMYGKGSSGKGVGPEVGIVLIASLKADRDSKNAGSRELFSAVALPVKKQELHYLAY